MAGDNYVSQGQIDSIAKRWYESLRFHKRWNTSIHQKDTCLMVIDMQNFFLQERSHAFLPAARAILPKVNEIIEFFRENQMVIVFTVHSNIIGEEGVMGEWWHDAIYDDERSEIYHKVNYRGEKTIKKERYSAFMCTDLDKELKDMGIRNIILTGVMTHICVLATAIDAFMHNFRPYILADATATINEVFHISALDIISHAYGEVTLWPKLRQRLQ